MDCGLTARMLISGKVCFLRKGQEKNISKYFRCIGLREMSCWKLLGFTCTMRPEDHLLSCKVSQQLG